MRKRWIGKKSECKKTMKILQNENYTISLSNNTRIELKQTRNCVWKTTDLLNDKKSNLAKRGINVCKQNIFAKSWRFCFNINKSFKKMVDFRKFTLRN